MDNPEARNDYFKDWQENFSLAGGVKRWLLLPRIDKKEGLKGSFYGELCSSVDGFILENGIDGNDGFRGVSAEHLRDVIDRLLTTDTVDGVYTVMAEAFPGDTGKETVRSWYDVLIEPQHQPLREPVKKVLSDLYRDSAVDRALDVGAGTGNSTSLLFDYAAHITAIDVSSPMLAILRKRFDAAQKSNQIICADVVTYDFPNNEYFDLIFANGLFRYLPEREAITVFSKLLDRLQMGGRFMTLATNGVMDTYSVSPRAVLAGMATGLVTTINTSEVIDIMDYLGEVTLPADITYERSSYFYTTNRYNLYVQIARKVFS